MQSKIIVITGANSGIGKATATELAQQSATVVMVCRSAERGEAARQEVIKNSSNTNVFLELCDLASHESIKDCTKRIRAKYDYVDVLINNAGAIFGDRRI